MRSTTRRVEGRKPGIILPGVPFSFFLKWMLVISSVYGGCSSVGRVPDCDSGCRGFETHRPPHFFSIMKLFWFPLLRGCHKSPSWTLRHTKRKNAIFPFLAETTTWRRCFRQHIHVLHEVVAKLSLLRQPLSGRVFVKASIQKSGGLFYVLISHVLISAMF